MERWKTTRRKGHDACNLQFILANHMKDFHQCRWAVWKSATSKLDSAVKTQAWICLKFLLGWLLRPWLGMLMHKYWFWLCAQFVPQQTLKRVVLHTIRGKQPQNFSATSRNYLGAKNPCLWGELGGFDPAGTPNTVCYPLGLATTPQNTFRTMGHQKQWQNLLFNYEDSFCWEWDLSDFDAMQSKCPAQCKIPLKTHSNMTTIHEPAWCTCLKAAELSERCKKSSTRLLFISDTGSWSKVWANQHVVFLIKE